MPDCLVINAREGLPFPLIQPLTSGNSPVKRPLVFRQNEWREGSKRPLSIWNWSDCSIWQIDGLLFVQCLDEWQPKSDWRDVTNVSFPYSPLSLCGHIPQNTFLITINQSSRYFQGFPTVLSIVLSKNVYNTHHFTTAYVSKGQPTLKKRTMQNSLGGHRKWAGVSREWN